MIATGRQRHSAIHSLRVSLVTSLHGVATVLPELGIMTSPPRFAESGR
jgi:hypothetical protein